MQNRSTLFLRNSNQPQVIRAFVGFAKFGYSLVVTDIDKAEFETREMWLKVKEFYSRERG